MDLSALAPFWIVFPLLSAFFHASRLAVTKHLSLSFSARALTLYVNLASLVVTAPLVIWHHDFPLHDPRYIGAVLVGGVVSGLGAWALNHAIKISEISLVGPVISLTPGFVILIEWVVTGDRPGLLGFAGIALLITGSYLVSLERDLPHWYTPLLRLLAAPGSRFALIAAFCFAGASTFGRVAIQLSDPLSFAVMVSAVNPLILLLIFTMQDRYFYREVVNGELRRHVRPLLLLGVLFALMRVADQIALSLTLASYAMAVKRTAGMFSVVLGWLIYREHQIAARLAGSLVMLAGLFFLLRD